MLMRVDNVSVSFGGLLALKGVSFSVQKGEILGIIGPNGAGKTTLFNIINGVYKPDEGDVFIVRRSNHRDKAFQNSMEGYRKNFSGCSAL